MPFAPDVGRNKENWAMTQYIFVFAAPFKETMPKILAAFVYHFGLNTTDKRTIQTTQVQIVGSDFK